MAKQHSDYALILINQLKLEEKIALVAGHNFMYTNAVPRLNIPSIRMSDGPHGLRVQGDNEIGVMAASSATCFPTAATTANSWDPKLLEQMGAAMGMEARFYGIDIILGPGVNIKRNPLCGRNFEYFSEDPLLAGKLGAGEVIGIQSQGVGTSLKHYAFNNEENHRFMGDSIVDMRAIREIYLKPFEYIIKNAKPETVMNAYNKVNGTYCSENKWLLTDVLRNQWGFDGLVMTDWGATHNRIKGIKAGNDLEMPGDTTICRKWIFDAVNDGTLDVKELDERVLNVLDLVSKHLEKNKLETIDWEKHHELARLIAEDSAVLLKNDNYSLPLIKNEKICVIGELFEKMRYQGAGSSMINPALLTTCKDAFDKHEVNYIYFKGYKESEVEPSESLIKEAVEGSNNYDKVLLFIGLTDNEESEGGDRDNMSLPANQLALVDALIKENKKIIVVLFGGSASELPFFDEISALLNMFLPGQNGGEATYNLLFGLSNPSGRLAQTWPIKYSDVPYADEFGKTKQAIYKESIFVGYRYYMTANKEVRFPFGFGLSYTKFDYSGLNIKEDDNKIIVSLNVKNIGNYDGKDIIQVYVKGPESEFYKPVRELKGFTKASLKPSESQNVEVVIDKDDLKYWNNRKERFSLENGEYLIQIGRSSGDIILERKINITGDNLNEVYEKTVQNAYKNINIDEIDNSMFELMSGMKIPELPNTKPIDLESRFTELRQTLMGKILYKAVIGLALKDLKKAKKLPEGSERDNRIKAALSLKRMLESNSLTTMTMAAGTMFPYNFAEGFRDFANWHVIRGLKDFLTKIKAPKLPIDEVK